MDLDTLFRDFNPGEIKVDVTNKNALVTYFKTNVSQIVYLENGKPRTAVITANRALAESFLRKSGAEWKPKKPSKRPGNLEIVTYDMLGRRGFSIPLKSRWRIIRSVPITEKNMEELNERLHSVFDHNEDRDERKVGKK